MKTGMKKLLVLLLTASMLVTGLPQQITATPLSGTTGKLSTYTFVNMLLPTTEFIYC